MGEKTGITWCHHTFNAWLLIVVLGVVTGIAKSNPVSNIKSQRGMVGEGLDVVRSEWKEFPIVGPHVSLGASSQSEKAGYDVTGGTNGKHDQQG